MNTKTQTYREKGRAVFLAAIMVLSVVAMTASFAGAAAAANGNSSIGSFDRQVITAEDTEVTVEGVEIQGSSDGAIYIANSTGNIVGVSEALSPNDYDGSQDVVVQIDTAELDPTPETEEDYTAIIDEPGASAGDDRGDLSNNGDGYDTAGAILSHQAYETTNFDVPRVAFDGQEITVSFTVENIGVASNESVEVTAAAQQNYTGTSTYLGNGPQSLKLGAGEEQTFSYDVNTANLVDNEPDNATGYILAAGADNPNTGSNTGISTASTEFPSDVDEALSQGLTVGTDTEGEISVRTEDRDGDDLNGTTIELYRSNDWTGDESTSTPIRTIDLNNNDNAHTFEELAVGSNSGSDSVDYVIRADKDEFSSETDQVQLFEPDQTGPTRILTLASSLEPNVFGVGAFNNETDRVTGNTSAVFANGEFDSQGEFAVFTQTQSDSDATLTGDQEVTVNLWVANRTGDKGTVPLEFVTNQTDENTTQNQDGTVFEVTITADSPTANLDDNSTTGEFSYETFNVTATNATQNNVDPLRTEEFFAWTTDIGSQNVSMDDDVLELGGLDTQDHSQDEHEPPIAQVSDVPLRGPLGFAAPVENYGSNRTDRTGTPYGPAVENRDLDSDGEGSSGMEALVNDVFYFVEGDKATQHQVIDVDNLAPVEDATVWAAYPGGPQDLSDIEDFQNADGESFLVAEHAPQIGDEIYVISGLVPDQEFNVYIKADGYNIFNTTEEGLALTGDQYIADYTLEEVIPDETAPGDGGGERYVMSHTLSETPLAYDLDVEAWNQTSQQWEKRVAIQDGTETEVRVTVTQGDIGADESTFSPAPNQEVDLSVINDPPGESGSQAGDLEGQDEVTVSTDADGQANVTFEAFAGLSAVQNISASTVNADGTEYNTTDDDPRDYNNRFNQSQIEVFTTGTITGDIVDDTDASRNVEGADVFLFSRESSTDPFTFESQVTSGSTGSYRFEDLPTDLEYRVTANITFDETEYEGFNNVFGINAGTNGGEDVVLQGLDLDEVEDEEWYSEYVDANDVVDDPGLNSAVQAYLSGELSDDELNTLIQSYLSSTPVPDL